MDGADGEELFRLAVRAPAALPERMRVTPARVVELTDGGAPGLAAVIPGDEAVVDVPHEFFLRVVFTLDVEDPDAVVGFLQKWGIPPLPRFHVVVGTDAPSCWCATLSSLHRWQVRDPAGGPARIPLFQARGHLAVLRAMVTQALELPGTLTAAGIVAATAKAAPAWEAAGIPASRLADDGPLTAVHTMCDLLDGYLTAAGPVAVRLLTPDVAASPLVDRIDTTSSVVAQQLAGHLAGGSDHRPCPKCGGWYVVQPGVRPRHGRRARSDAKYCSRSCAKAHAEAERRKRQRDQRRRDAEAADLAGGG